MFSPAKRRPAAVTMPIAVPIQVPMRSCQRAQEPGSPVTPPLTDPATSSGLHLLCLAANASPTPTSLPHIQLGAAIRGAQPSPSPSPSPSQTPPPQPQPPPAVVQPQPYPPTPTPAPMHGVAPPSPAPASFAYAPQGLPAQFLHPGFMPQYVTLPGPMGYYAPYYPSAPVAVRVLPDMGHTAPQGAHSQGVRKVKGPWRKEEDELLTALVGRFGARRWTTIAAHIPGRTGKQARERWLNQLSPDLAKRSWSAAEDRIVMDAHARLGNRWSEIAKLLKGRTDNAVKNRFNTTIRRQISELATSGAGTKRQPPASTPTSDCEGEGEPPRAKPRTQ